RSVVRHHAPLQAGRRGAGVQGVLHQPGRVREGRSEAVRALDDLNDACRDGLAVAARSLQPFLPSARTSRESEQQERTLKREELDRYRDQLRALSARVQNTTAGLEEQVRTPTGGEAGGGISNAPLHLADVGSEAYAQELSATLLENETY